MAFPLAAVIELALKGAEIYLRSKDDARLRELELEKAIQERMRNLPPVEDAVFIPVEQAKEK